MNRKLSLLGCLAAVALMCSSAEATHLYSQDFDANSSANWTVNTSAPATDTLANFFFDYSSIGIPSAPNSSGGSTRGLKMYANHAAGVFGGLSVSPNGYKLPVGNFTMKFDMWLNYNGAPTPGNGIGAGGTITPGGSGTTQAASWGVMTSGTSAQWAGGVHDSLWFASTHDGGATQDYRVYPKGALAAPATGYYAAGTAAGPTPPDARNDSAAYYQTAAFGNKAAPLAQLSLYPQQFGTTRTGGLGFAWRDVVVQRAGSIVTWKVDGVLMATVNLSTITGSYGGTNFFLGHFDTNATSSTDPNDTNLLFTLIDNVSVVPEPSSMTLMGLSLIGLLVRGKRS